MHASADNVQPPRAKTDPNPMHVSLHPLAAALLLTLPLSAFAGDLALGGFDPVAYVTQERAVPGRGDIVTTWELSR